MGWQNVGTTLNMLGSISSPAMAALTGQFTTPKEVRE